MLQRILEKTLMLGKIESKRGWRMRWLNSIADSVDMNLSKLWEIVEDRGAWRAAVHGVTKSWTCEQQKQHEVIKRLSGSRVMRCIQIFFHPPIRSVYLGVI